MDTRPETPADVRAIRQVNLAAFPTAAEADLVDALRASDAWIVGLSIVTEDVQGLSGLAPSPARDETRQPELKPASAHA